MLVSVSPSNQAVDRRSAENRLGSLPILANRPCLTLAPTDLVFARARETKKGVSERAALRRPSRCTEIDRRSGRVFVFVDEAAEEVGARELRKRRRSERNRAPARPLRWAKCKRAVRPMAVVVVGVGAQDMLELPPAEDEQPVEALATDAADPALGVGVRVRRLDGCADHRDPFSLEDVIEAAAELGVAIVDEEAERLPVSSSVISRLRACWATQALFGFAVQATNSIRRRSSEMKKST